jgi:hypothetical protein
MNSSKCFEVPRAIDPGKEHSGNFKVDLVPQKGHRDEQTPVNPYIPDEGTFETFVGGAGI